MKTCSLSVTPIMNGDRFNLNQCPEKELETNKKHCVFFRCGQALCMFRFFQGI